MSMTKDDLITKASKISGVSLSDSKLVVDAVIETVKETLNKDKEIQIRGFGTFKTVPRKEKKARNISTGATIIIPAWRQKVFKAHF